MTVRVRFAPSPTGEPHIGNIRTVVFNWLFARQNDGQFILRIEDTDRERYRPETIPVIMDGLRWLGLDWDEGPSQKALEQSGVENARMYAVGGPHGPYIQSERLEMYRQVAEELIERGWAYRCNCTPERLARVRELQRAAGEQVMYDRHCRDLATPVSPDEPHVVRLRVPLAGETVVHDAIRGDVTFDNGLIDDQILVKTDGYPTYHLAVVVDDHYMEISHVIRGDDWISSTPKRIFIYRAMDWEVPIYCHVPLVNGPDGQKLSKRHGATSITEFHEQGYLPEALFNFLALLGWSPGEGEEREIFSRDELIERFDLFRVSTAPATFSYDKLNWMNGVYIRELPEEELVERLLPFWQRAGLVPDPCPKEMRPKLQRIVPLIQERLKRLDEVAEWTAFMFVEIETPPPERLVPKGMTPEESAEMLRATRDLLAEIEPFEAGTIEQPLRDLTEELGVSVGQLLGTLRWATTNQKATPPLFGTLAVLGRERVLRRLDAAIERVEEGGQGML
ncbi:MAG: glutamate--tRNA ligase [Chloroflexota bacterium]|nr:glutamate--tRNA ligase [Chloroflexota bacterium]